MEKYIEFLAGAVDEITRQRNHLETLHRIHYGLKEILPVSCAALVLADPITEELAIVGRFNVAASLETAFRGRPRSPLIDRIFMQERLLIVTGDEAVREFAEIRPEGDFDQACLIRVSNQNRARGYLVILLKENFPINAAPRDFLMTLAGIISLALEKEETNECLTRLARSCAETSLLVYPFFIKRFEEEVMRASRYDEPLALTLMDIGNYREVMNTFGLETARLLVCEVAGAMRETLRENDVAGVYGADEFIVFAPKTRHDEGVTMCRRFMDRIQKGAFTDKKLATFFIVGLAIHRPGERADEFLFRTQQAYHEAQSSPNHFHCSPA